MSGTYRQAASSTEWMASSFLTSFCDVQKHSAADSSLVFFDFVAPDSFLRSADGDVLSGMLESFLTYNSDLHSACFLFQKGALAKCPDGLAMIMRPGEAEPHDMTLDADIFDSETRRRVSEAGHMTSFETTPDDEDALILALGTPIRDSSGGEVGQFWIDIPASKISAMLQSGGNYFSMVLDSSGRILSSDKEICNGLYLSDLHPSEPGLSLPSGWTASVEEALRAGTQGSFRSHSDGVRTSTYVYPISRFDSFIVIVKSDEKVQGIVSAVRRTMTVVSLLSFLILLLCSGYAFREYRRQSDRTSRLESELSVAADIQRSMLPPSLDGEGPVSVIGFQRSAKAVGGDLYDYVLKDGRLSFCIGDVSGDGVPAALLMTVICDEFRQMARRLKTPADIASAVNETLLDRGEDTMFCTLFVGVMDLSSGEVDYCCAGHNPPFIVRSDGGACLMDVEPNFPTGVFDECPWEQGRVSLGKGDSLYLYTDGVTEARDAAGAFFGEERLREVLSGADSSDIPARVMESLDAYSAGAEQHDDITMLCIRRNS